MALITKYKCKDYSVILDNTGQASLFYNGVDRIPQDLHKQYEEYGCAKVVVGRNANKDIVDFLVSHPDITSVDFMVGWLVDKELERLKHLHSLGISQSSSAMLDLTGFHKLKQLVITYVEPVKRLHMLPSGLEEITVSPYPEADLEALASLLKLRELRIIQGRLNSVSQLSGLQSLRKIVLGYQKNLTSLGGLEAHEHLESVELFNLPQVIDARPIISNKNIKQLTVEKVGIGPNIDWVLSLPKLEWLNLDVDRIDTLKPILNLKNLKHLSIGDSKALDNNLAEVAKLGLESLIFTPRKGYNFKRTINSDSGEMTEYWPDGTVTHRKWDQATQLYSKVIP